MTGKPMHLVETAVDACAKHFGVKPEDVMGRQRYPEIVAARHTAWALLRRRGMGLSQIARAFGVDHTSVLHGAEQGEKRLRGEQTGARVGSRKTQVHERPASPSGVDGFGQGDNRENATDADKISKITARQALEVWGLRVCGGSLKSPTKKATGGNASVDDEMSLARYVEATPGFERARPALVHVYTEGQPVESFRLRHPGETTIRALIRLGWMGYLIHPPSCIACEVLREFEAALEAKIADCPWWPPSSLCSPDDEADIPAGMVWSETLRKYIKEAKEEK